MPIVTQEKLRDVDEMQLFEDAELTKPIDKLDFKRLAVGHSYTKELYLANLSEKWPLVNIKCNESDDQLKIVYPEIIRPATAVKIEVQWSPGLKRREPLDVSHLFTGEIWIG